MAELDSSVQRTERTFASFRLRRSLFSTRREATNENHSRTRKGILVETGGSAAHVDMNAG